MKHFIFSVSALAMLTLAACSSDDDPAIDNPADGDYSTHYMSVNIVMAGNETSRADTERGYEYGTTAENKVSKIRFYFYTENGEAANVKLSPTGYVNYYNWEAADITQQWETSSGTAGNVESHIAANIVINTPAGDQLPRKMVAVINPNEFKLSTQGFDILKATTGDYAAPSLTTEGNFVMTNSVYAEESPLREVSAVFIENSNICESMDAAKASPVTLYVERNVAKVQVSYDNSLFTDGKMALKDKANADITVANEPVYLKLLAWGLTAETNKSFLNKNINLKWGSSWWNEGHTEHRCSWARNAQGAQNVWENSYTTIGKNFGSTDCLYTNENAAPYSDGETTSQLAKTKFIVKGQLCNKDGNPITLVRHLGVLFADTYSTDEAANLTSLKSSILTYLQTNGYHYWKNTDNGRKEIEPSDIAIECNSTDTYIKRSENSLSNCYVHAKLTTAAEGMTWYASADATDTTPIGNATINNVLKDKEKVGDALVWREGQTYYYKEIVHRNASGDTYPTAGVVRNHVYKANISAITGLGTPVYDPSAIIYPETPNPDDHYIAAKIEILSWRTVSYDYTLDW